MSMYSSGFFVNDTATTEIYTYCTLFPYTTLFRSLLEARPAVALERGAVGLIETGLEHEGQVELGGNLLQVARRLQRQARVLQHVQPEDAEERLAPADRSEEHTSELQSLMRITYAVLCLKQKYRYSIFSTTRIGLKL